MLVTLTGQSGSSLDINPIYIASAVDATSSTRRTFGTEITLVNGARYIVKETREELRQLIRQALT